MGTGKSSLLEFIGAKHLAKGAAILDLFGSVDGESLAWLRSPYANDSNILLLRGENVDVETSYDVKQFDKLTMKDLERYDIIISSRPLYVSKDAEYYAVGKICEKLYKRLSYKKMVFLLAREASSLWYSRIRVSTVQTDAKSEALYMLRELRHLGVSLGLDSLRFLAIDVDLRSHTDYLFLKAAGISGLPYDLKWLYYFFNPAFIRNMKPWEFALVCRQGALALGHFPEVSWHKQEKENILKALNLKLEYGEMVEPPKDRGLYQTVDAKEHSRIIALYIEGMAQNKIASRSIPHRSSKTINDHIRKHNAAVNRSGFCAFCRKVGSQYDKQLSIRRKRTREDIMKAEMKV